MGDDKPAAIVTGASRGIGAAIARRLAGTGRHLILLQRGDGATTLDQIRAAGGTAESLSVDLTDTASAEKAIKSVLDKHRGTDVFISNAAAITRVPARDTTTASFSSDIAIGLVTPFALAREFAASRIDNGQTGSIVFLSSVLAYQGGMRVPAYSSVKAALVNLTRSLANEWAGLGIRVNAVAPGYVDTEFTASLREDEERRRGIDLRIPVGRWATPEEIASAVGFLVDPSAGYVHGHTLVVDGGWLGM